MEHFVNKIIKYPIFQLPEKKISGKHKLIIKIHYDQHFEDLLIYTVIPKDIINIISSYIDDELECELIYSEGLQLQIHDVSINFESYSFGCSFLNNFLTLLHVDPNIMMFTKHSKVINYSVHNIGHGTPVSNLVEPEDLEMVTHKDIACEHAFNLYLDDVNVADEKYNFNLIKLRSLLKNVLIEAIFRDPEIIVNYSSPFLQLGSKKNSSRTNFCNVINLYAREHFNIENYIYQPIKKDTYINSDCKYIDNYMNVYCTESIVIVNRFMITNKEKFEMMICIISSIINKYVNLKS